VTFLDRRDAGERLARRLLSYRRERPVVVALPRGGVAVAREVARELSAPLDVLVVRKIGTPFEPELAMGALAEGMPPVVVRNEDVLLRARITEAEFQDALDIAARELTRRKHLFRGDREPLSVEGRTVLLVDDGIATGATVRAAVESLKRRRPKRIVLAIPIAPTDVIDELRPIVDDVVCLDERAYLGVIGHHYADFRPVSEDEVVRALLHDATGSETFAHRVIS
jgi:putative phosphoribosyl transferase